jgi:predicted RNase H-like HicB family nuclease
MARDIAEQPYTVTLYPSEASDGSVVYVAQVKEIPGCIADGRTRKEAAAEVEHALVAVLEYVLDQGVDIPLPRLKSSRTGRARSADRRALSGKRRSQPAPGTGRAGQRTAAA